MSAFLQQRAEINDRRQFERSLANLEGELEGARRNVLKEEACATGAIELVNLMLEEIEGAGVVQSDQANLLSLPVNVVARLDAYSFEADQAMQKITSCQLGMDRIASQDLSDVRVPAEGCAPRRLMTQIVADPAARVALENTSWKGRFADFMQD